MQDDEKPALKNGDTIYLTHSSLLPYMVDSSGNDVFGIVESPSPTAAYRNRKTAQQKAPDFYLQEVVIGEVNPQGAGKILDLALRLSAARPAAGDLVEPLMAFGSIIREVRPH
ncbi:hypothetical protein [Glutamicibacter sp. FBE19]|uniref:hypothetical protein n=1 Tax=Glutamicibacter sp. FBE19 TaxID=2761534 RepID=UPI0018966A22|nr:hypothetical protein [Glutamicibacter sp. FBE19]MBF6672594.1 hypothetical protein [Glutamicibacter sp. FBE19]